MILNFRAQRDVILHYDCQSFHILKKKGKTFIFCNMFSVESNKDVITMKYHMRDELNNTACIFHPLFPNVFSNSDPTPSRRDFSLKNYTLSASLTQSVAHLAISLFILLSEISTFYHHPRCALFQNHYIGLLFFNLR